MPPSGSKHLWNVGKPLADYTVQQLHQAASTSETSVNFYQTTRHNPEDSHFHTRRHENLKTDDIGKC
jgi:predicted AlkP superfamily pyrophosphatase or phosphodiesterase